VAQDLFFGGLGAPLRFDEAEAVLRLMPGIATGWRYDVRATDPAIRPFFTIRPKPGTEKYLCENLVEPAPARLLDAVNAACDAMAAVAQAMAAEDARLLCLHAAGVVMAGRLVIFPNVRRAGKSTLSVALAQAGHLVFSDDVLPLVFPEGSPARGLAMGLAPRLRLPLPESAGQPLRDWVAATPGPQNRQYRYLSLQGQPAHGETVPLGAFVILDRQDASVSARLDHVAPDTAMDALLHQNFTRDRHSGEILQALAALLNVLPVFRLTYFDLQGAVDCLDAAFPDRSADLSPEAGPVRPFSPAQVDAAISQPQPGHPISQRPHAVARVIGTTLYLADPEGRAIHRMDPLAAAIWDILATPATADEIEALLAEAFPAVDRPRIAADLNSLLTALVGWGLVA
jgi:Coenzyme PQQ synthesis protein D (PqqD)